jgi:hypothetical protein
MNLNLPRIAFLACFLPLSAAPTPSPITLRVDSVSFIDAAADRVHLEVALGVSTHVHLTLKSARFETMRLNGMPLYIAPLAGKLDLDPAKKWQSVRLAPITIYFRDLETLAPLRRLVNDETAEFEGQARVELDLAPAPRVVLPLRQRTPVAVPGGSVGREAILATLTAADATLHVGGEVAGRVREFFGWTDGLVKQYGPSLFLIEARYRYSHDGRNVVRTARSAGFAIAANRIVTTAEALRPWAYDAEAALLLESGAAVLDDQFYDVRVWPAGAPAGGDTAFTLHNHRLKAAAIGSAVESVLVATGGNVRGVRLGKRDAEGNAGVVELLGQARAGVPVQGVATPAMEWDHVALFRFPASRTDASVDMIYVSVRRSGDRIRLSEPVDSTAFGSPLVLPGGAIGMLQDETSGMPFEKLVGFALPAK